MTKHLPAFLWCMGLLCTGMTQVKNSIRGRVVQDSIGTPVAGASVFITNTSKGTVSDSSGAFELLNVPEGAYDLIISSIGYETIAHGYKAADLPLRLEVHLKRKTEELEAVVVEPDEKDGWNRWGQFFIENFVGTNENGRASRIKNPNTLRFRYSRKNNLLKVIADEPLVIENKGLGYQVKYQLESFYFDFRSHMLVYYGYSLFSNLDKKGPSKRQLKNREKAYNGSIMHFMRSLYHDSLAANGFEVRRMIRRPNEEKLRVKEAYRRSLRASSATIQPPPASGNPPILRLPGAGTASIRSSVSALPKDSSEYYSRVMRQPDVIDEFGKSLLTADSLLTTTGKGVKSLFFTDYLYIVYRNEKEDADYLSYVHETRPPWFQRSNAFLPDKLSITIEPTGNYYPPQTFMTLGYWAWNEKIGDMLPIDFRK